MHLINLPEVIQAAGADWPKLKDKLRTDSTSFLKACLDDDDLVIPAGDGFLIVFATAGAAEVKTRGEELRDVLLEFYRGQEGLKHLGIGLKQRTFGGAELGAMFAAPPSRAPAKGHECLFAPVWSARAQAIASYFGVPVRNGRPGYDDGFAYDAKHISRDYAELDLKLLTAAEEALASYSPEEARPLIGISIHATTMTHRAARGAVLERLAKIEPALMKYVVVSVAEIEPGAPIIKLADWAGMLRARTPRIMLEFHHSDAPPNLSQVGVAAAGYRAPRRADDDRAAIAGDARQLQRWGELLTRQRLPFFVADMDRTVLGQVALKAGAQFFTSAPLWPLVTQPGGVVSAPAPFPIATNTVSSGPS